MIKLLAMFALVAILNFLVRKCCRTFPGNPGLIGTFFPLGPPYRAPPFRAPYGASLGAELSLAR